MDELNNENLLAWAQAQLDRNRLLQDANTLERRRQGIQLQIIESAASLTQDVRILISELRIYRETQEKQAAWVDKSYEDLANRLERLEQYMVLLLTEQHQSKRLDAAQVLENEQSIRTQLKKHYRNLNKLDEQAAGYAGEVPIHLQNKIEEERAEITRLEEKLS